MQIRDNRRHEAEFLAGLIDAGREVLEIDVEAGRLAAVAATEQAMRDGAEIVYQMRRRVYTTLSRAGR